MRIQRLQDIILKRLNEQIGTTYSIDYGKMTAVLIEAIKDLKAENNALAARVAALEAS